MVFLDALLLLLEIYSKLLLKSYDIFAKSRHNIHVRKTCKQNN